MNIIIDAMGGDNAPLEIVKGALSAHARFGCDITLTGDETAIRAAAAQCGAVQLPAGVAIHPTTETVDMCDDPATVFRRKKDTSMGAALTLLRDGAGDAAVSAGSTGALLTGATLITKRIHGIRRAAMAPVIPTTTGSAVLIDCGATAEGTPEYLMQFAYMGSYYAQRFLGVENPRVALLNIGAEESKGLELQKQTYALLTEAKQAGRIHFVGNIEGREAITQGVDVLVTDGYTGNIFLKTMEGAAALFSGALKDMLLASTKNKVAALMLKNSIGDFKKRFDSSEVGGTALLGISQPVVKAHGSSNAYAFYNAIRQAKTVAEADIVGDIAANVEHMRWERPKPAEKQEEG